MAAKYTLIYFDKKDIIITQDEAWNVLRFFWPNTNVNPGGMTDKDKAFAQALLVEAIDTSYKMGFVEIIYRIFYMKVSPSFKKIYKMVRKFAVKALKHWFKHATGEDLKNPKIYESVRKDLARNFHSSWSIREQTGELTY